jgi:hypothetical protein
MNEHEEEEYRPTSEQPVEAWHVRYFPALLGIAFVLLFAILVLLAGE